MKHVLIVGHPDANSFTLGMAKAYGDAATRLGHTHVVRDLYRLGFDPCLKLSEMPGRGGWSPAPDVEAERTLLQDADVFAFIYPLWFNAPPAIIKGYIERVFGEGFGFSDRRDRSHTPLLQGRQLLHITASGSSTAWLNEQGAWISMRTLFEDYFGNVCGMRVRPHIHFDSIVPGLEARWAAANFSTLETKVTEYFGPA